MLAKLIQGKCPKCGKGKIYESKGSIFLAKLPKMNERCSNCGYHFDREPGYFFGAMYVSYGLTIIEMLAVFFLAVSFVSLPVLFILLFLMLVLTMFFNWRLSRIIWIHIFHQ